MREIIKVEVEFIIENFIALKLIDKGCKLALKT
jgi:hypothetical protein